MVLVNDQIKRYVVEKDIEGVKSTLTGLAYVGDSESFQEFKASTEYAKRNIDNLFEPDDGLDFSVEYTLSDYKNIAKMMMKNFSEKKYDAAIKIGAKVFQNKESNKTIDNEVKEENPLTEALKNPAKLIIATLVILAVIILIVKLI